MTLSSPESFYVLFDITSIQTVELKWLMLVVGVDVFDLDFGSKLIRSNNQSRATLWVLETSLIVGLLPLKNHLDHCFVVLKQTHSTKLLDAKIGRLREHGQHFSKRRTFLEIAGLARDLNHGKQRVSPFHHGSESCFQRTKTIGSHKSRAGIPSNLNPASKEMISDCVELCESEVCFLHIPLIGTSV